MEGANWLDSLLTESAHSSTVGRRLYKKRNVDFLLGESHVVVDIPDHDAPKLSEGMDEEATKLLREPKKELDDATNSGDGFFGQESEGGFQISPDSTSPSTKDSIVACSSSLPLASPGIYIQEWGLNRESILT